MPAKSSYPTPLRLPESVQAARKLRRHRLSYSLLLGMLLRGIVVLIELGGYLAIDSYSLLLDAVASMIDIAGSTFIYFCIQLASRPPDRKHPFGHGRYELLGGLQLGLFLFVSGVVAALSPFLLPAMNLSPLITAGVTPSHQLLPIWGWMIPACCLILLEIAYKTVLKTAKEENSVAMEADALHYRIDSINSLIALLALACSALTPKHGESLDLWGGILIACLMVVFGLYTSWSNFRLLLSPQPADELVNRIRMAAMKAEGVLGVEKLGIQENGPDGYVHIDVEVDPTLSVEEGHKISQLVRYNIQLEWPLAWDVIVHIEPFYPDDH